MATPDTAAKLEEISAAALTEVIARGEAADYIAQVGALAGIVLLAHAMRKAEREYLKGFDAATNADDDYMHRTGERYTETYKALIDALDALSATVECGAAQAEREAADNIRLATAVKRLLDAVDFTAPPHADVRVCNLWGAATALRELRELVRGADDARI